MTYQIIGDSCLDLTSGMREDARFGTVPLTLQVGDETVVDDESFNQAKFLAMVRACPQCPKTACPSPELFLERYRKAGTDVVFVITLSCHLSGSYNSAMTAKQIYDEEQKAGTGPSTRVEVIDSLSASPVSCASPFIFRDFASQRRMWMRFLRRPWNTGTG